MTQKTVSWQEMHAMVDTLPLSLVCIIAHQSNRHFLQKPEVERLLDLFPDEQFEAIKEGIRNDEEMFDEFKTVMQRVLQNAREETNYIGPFLPPITVLVDGVPWNYGGTITIFPKA